MGGSEKNIIGTSSPRGSQGWSGWSVSPHRVLALPGDSLAFCVEGGSVGYMSWKSEEGAAPEINV